MTRSSWVLLAASLGLLSCVGDSSTRVSGPDPFIDLVLEDPHGRSIRMADYGNRVRVIDVWATWCAPCRAVIPHLNDLHERYHNQGLTVLGIAVDSSPAEVVEFQREVPMRYLTGMFNADVEKVIGQPEAVPTTYLVDRSGAIRRTWLGTVDAGTIEREILRLLR